ncbi:LysR family transcriptional regulator [Ensifer adhaerens]|uniref:LysR family transcriptional regulator n=1 Tax=Ensifer adhaerens TaxID=106592 RepID=A0A0L8C2L1_ENSAD|nr:LysR family transcriptional regulator [Ensifer adhaerens]KOF21044.1 LysR family transcriptional regulator [Ensifer adhaerens]
MDIRFLQSLVATVETGSIAAAARREKLTPAAVSQRIQSLERALGCVLLARGAHSAQPTEACLSLLPRARLLIREAENLRYDVAGGGLTAELKVGSISTALTGIFPEVLDELSHRAPSLKLMLRPGSSLQLYEQLLSGELDAAVLVEPPFALPKGLTAHVIRREPLVLISKDATDLDHIHERIRQAPFIRYDPGSWGGRLSQQYLADAGLDPDIRCDMDALETIAILVANGMGNSVVPAWQGLQRNGFHLTEVPDAAAYERRIVFLHQSVPSRPTPLALLKEILSQGLTG